jgi:hypothetical protein
VTSQSAWACWVCMASAVTTHLARSSLSSSGRNWVISLVAVHLGLGQDYRAGVVHHRQQVHRRPAVVTATAQGLAVDGDRPPRRAGDGGDGLAAGGCWTASQAPMARSRASASMRASTGRTVASPGGCQAPVRG